MKRVPVMPGALPAIGHALAFLRDKPGFLASARARCGDVVQLQLAGTTLLLNDPLDVKHVLVDAAPCFEKTTKLTSARGRELSGEGLHTSTGAEHLQLRRMVQPLFHRQLVAAHSGAVEHEVSRWLSRWRDGMVVDIWQEMLGLTQQIMLRALFGSAPVADEAAFGAAVALRRRYIEYFFTSNLPAADHLPLPIVFQYRRARRTIDRVLLREIQRRRTQATGTDWLSMLVHAEGRDGARFTDAQVRDEAMTLTSTGYETVAAALCWTVHLLAHHPSVQQELAAEDWHVDQPSGQPTLLARVLDEAMRLYPPTWLYVRVATTATVLPSGYPVDVGTKVYLSPYTMHRHPAWYDQPDQFNPRRNVTAEGASRPRFAYFPFGGGARQCIGEPFARMEALQVLRLVLPRFALVPRTALTVPLRASIVLEPRGGLPVELRSRKAP